MNYYAPATTSVVLLAAGRGQRMRSLTEQTPKPLLKVGGISLIEHHLRSFQSQGFRNIVVNLDYLGKKIVEQLGDGAQYGLSIEYSDESEGGALETAGGLKHALPLINSDPFLVVNSDIWVECDFTELLAPLTTLGRLVLVNNPSHNPQGDFALNHSGLLQNRSRGCFTYSGIALYRKSIFEDLSSGKQPLAPIFRQLIAEKRLEGVKYNGVWTDVGTPERLQQLNQQLRP
ncbi:MAG: MurNAc alpha-1-phosphate uridylyltransferase [Cryomorphaceae bacterium]|jgi:MurNAc alpha-1-phosphate uridylyltransferase